MQTNKTHWTSLSILIVLGLSVAFAFLITVGLGIDSITDLFSKMGDPAGQMISAYAFGFQTMILLVCSWFVLQKTLGRDESSDLPFKFPFELRHVSVIIGMVILSVSIGGVLASLEIAWVTWVILPLLTLFVIVLPIWLLLGLGTKEIELGPRWRIFGILGLSLTLGPLVMIALEIIVLLVMLFAGLILVAMQNPALFHQLAHLGRIITRETDPDAILKLFAPYISNPVAIAAALGYIALLVPMIEELFKPLAVWIFVGKIESPSQGFGLGLLSGAAFTLIESLNASGDGTTSWPIIVSVRAITSLLHITASGLVGWGIVSAFQKKRSRYFFAAYFCASLIHGIWNACAVGAVLATAGEVVGRPGWLFNIIPAMLGGMAVLAIGMFFMLIAFNRKLRSANIPLEGAGIQK